MNPNVENEEDHAPTSSAGFEASTQGIKSRIERLWAQIWEASFFFNNIHLPLAVTVLYFAAFAVFYTQILSIPVGVNYIFASTSRKYLALVAVGSTLILFAILKTSKRTQLNLVNPTRKFSPGDLLLLLLPLTPVAQYILHNQEILSLSGALLVVLIFTLFSGAFVFIFPALLGFAGSTRTWISLGLAFTFTLTSMAALSQGYAWYEHGHFLVQWGVLGAVFVAVWLLFEVDHRKLLRLLISLVFISNSAIQLYSLNNSTNQSGEVPPEHRLLTRIEGKTPVTTPNIYLLVYDAYVVNETMLGYGIDNAAQEEYLSQLGFQRYPHTYSVENHSLGSMSDMLNISTDSYGNPRRAVSGDGIVQNALSKLGYQTYGIFPHDYYFLGIQPTYDVSIPGRPSSPDILSRAIFMGEFRFDVGYNTLPHDQFIEAKHEVFETITDQPKFVYTHSNLPGHSQNSGTCLPDEVEAYQERLSIANDEMRQDLELILEKDPQAIIVVAGDHGPYLTKNCTSIEEGYSASEITRLDVQDRFGTFLAIRWSGGGNAFNDDITVLQDVFPVVFATMFADEGLLEAKIDPITRSTIVRVKNGVIIGGENDGEPLFLAGR